MKILLVEDDEQTAAMVASALTLDRHVVNIATDGQIGLELAETYAYDLILLDVQLPKVDGVTVCRQLRSQGHTTPILLLTARNQPSDKIKGLDAGADDYVVKPFDLDELKARVRALLRRGTSSTLPVLTWEHLQLDPNAGEVRYNGKLLPLTRKEYCLLELFLRHPQRVFSRNIIIDRLWSAEDSPLESAVTTHIKDLRRKLKAGGLTTELIETVYGLGYRLKPPPTTGSSAGLAADRPNRSSDSSASALTQSSANLPPDLTAVQQVLARFRSTLTDQIAVLQQFGLALQAGSQEAPLRQQAQQEAHKLAGSLGIFGYPQGSDWARELEQLLAAADPIEVNRYQQLVQAIEQQLAQPPRPLNAYPDATASPSPVTLDPQPVVLVVDDDPLVLAQLQHEAVAAGVQLVGAPHPEAARHLVAQIQPNLVLLDLNFGNAPEDGLTLLAELGRQDPALPVLVFTQRNSLLDRVRVSRLGGRGFLAKSLPLEQVMQTIVQVLRGSQSAAARVLVVDDDADTLASLTELLQPWGLQVIPLEDPQLFWDVLTATAPDLLVLDLDLPTFSGIDLCQVVRQDPQWGNLPILMATTHTDATTIQQVFAAGADDFIAKPMVGPELVTRITSRIERVRLRQQLAQLEHDHPLYSSQPDSIVRQTHQKLTSALQAAKIGTWQLFLPTEELLASAQCKANVGLPPEADLSYSRLLQHIHPEDRERVQQLIRQSLLTQTDYKAEYRCIWPDGSLHWVLASGHPTYAEDGTAIRMDGITLDITDRKQAEAALQDLLERFELVTRGSQDGIWEVRYTSWDDLGDPQREVYYSPRLRELLGYSEQELLNTPESYLSRIHPDDLQRVMEAVRAHLFERAPYQDVEHRMLTASGEYRWVSARGQALWAEDGQPLRFAGSVRDITDRRQVEAELRQAKVELEARVAERTAELQQGLARLQQAQAETQKFICLIESSNDFIGIASLEGQALYVNKAGQMLVGLEGDEAVRCTHISDYFLPDDLEEFQTQILPTAMQQGRWVGEYRFRHFQTGEPIPVHYNFFTVRDETGQPIALATVTQDIRHRKQAEAALRESEAKFRSLSECSPIGIFMTDVQGEVIYINPRIQEICGCSYEQSLGSGWLQCIHPDERDAVAAQWYQAIREQRRYVNVERYLHRDGTIRCGQVQTAPIFAADGGLIGYVGTVEDITESRAIEQIKNEFISVVSHELRTPLTSIHGSLGLLASGIYDDKPDKARRMIEIAVADTDRLVRLVNDILDLERLESGKVVLEKQSCDVFQLMQRSVEAMHAIAQSAHITLSITPVTAQVWANPDAIIQTLTNLLSNAIKFSPAHTTVWLTAEPMTTSLLPALAPVPYVRFAVRDQGRGIPPDKLETIFGRFQQVDASDSRQKGGTGLGLAICQSIVQQHNGQIWAERNPDSGSTFYFTLPSLPSEAS
ncbi:MAG: PAS domain-containing protein [Synechococcales cyanobacterium M58_A2018_015]|nr:PAS domain-containing protein [Synechococcales cyanobacterium M58_A2018_015]